MAIHGLMKIVKNLMRYGSELKLSQYYFAPKDDPYHNKKWRELYPEEKLAEIRELARVVMRRKHVMSGLFIHL